MNPTKSKNSGSKFKLGYYDLFVQSCAKYPSNTAIIHYNNGQYFEYSYSELFGICEYISQCILQVNCTKGIVGLLTEKNILVPSLMAAVHKCRTTFMFIDPSAKNLDQVLSSLGIETIISIGYNELLRNLFHREPNKTIKLFNLAVSFYVSVRNSKNAVILKEMHSFIASTSGTTGTPKYIQVPMSSILPNISDLTIVFEIDTSDIIYFSTPLTFDPSMVEVLLACSNGAALLIAPDECNILFPHNKENSVTVWQTTPSKFLQHSSNEICSMLSRNSTLKILALGGEPLNGAMRLKMLKSKRNKTRIYVLYGVTEMSCWACLTELKVEKVKGDSEIPLGRCLSETSLKVEIIEGEKKNIGNVMLESSTRKCYALKSNNLNKDIINTGDIAEVKKGVVYYIGRSDEIIKRFGNKVDLRSIEKAIMSCLEVKACSCIWVPKQSLLVAYFTSDVYNCDTLKSILKKSLEPHDLPDHLVRIERFPITTHGKTSKSGLTLLWEKDTEKECSLKSRKSLDQDFVNELQNSLDISFHFNDFRNMNYMALGGTSFGAVALCNKLSMKYPRLGNKLLPKLLSNVSIDNVIKSAYELNAKQSNMQSIGNKRIFASQSEQVVKKNCKKAYPSELNNLIKIRKKWSFNMKKCIDASPTIYDSKGDTFVIVGSHSGNLISYEALSGGIAGKIKLKSRIQASVCVFSSTQLYGVVGCYDGTIVCVALPSCESVWSVNIGSMVKSKATTIMENIYIAAYDGKIRVLDVKTGHVKKVVKVSNSGISADLALAKNLVIAVSLSGLCVCLDSKFDKIRWRAKLNSPVFANPVLYDNDTYVILLAVNGSINCRNVQTGLEVWKYEEARGNIFSSAMVTNDGKDAWQIIFGCHDNNIYNLSVIQNSPKILWKCALPSPVYVTPCQLNSNVILGVSTNGYLCIIGLSNGKILSTYKLPGELFSSPKIYAKHIFVGCRDDCFYALKYS